MRNKKAEIGTVMMMAFLVVISVVAFGSSSLFNNKNTTQTQASARSCKEITGNDSAYCMGYGNCSAGYVRWSQTPAGKASSSPRELCNNTLTGTCCVPNVMLTPEPALTDAPTPTVAVVAPANPGKCGSGNFYNCDPAEGYDQACPAELEFNCCVADQFDGTNYRIRRYGCTGQYCKNTKINNALGHLVGCAGFVDANNETPYPLNESQTAIVFSPPQAPPTSDVTEVPNEEVTPVSGIQPTSVIPTPAGENNYDCGTYTSTVPCPATTSAPTQGKCYPINCPPPDEAVKISEICSDVGSDGKCLIETYYKNISCQDKPLGSYSKMVDWCRLQPRTLKVEIIVNVINQNLLSDMNTADPQQEVYVVNMNDDHVTRQSIPTIGFPIDTTLDVSYYYNYHGPQAFYVGYKYKKLNGMTRNISPNFSAQEYPGGESPLLIFTLDLK